MSNQPESFDAYHRWLGISPKDQPPNHYRLLGIDQFESDEEVIRDAAERQMAHVRRYQLGQHTLLSQKILTELAIAKTCLLDSDRKAEYDDYLRETLAAGPPTGEYRVGESWAMPTPPMMIRPPQAPVRTPIVRARPQPPVRARPNLFWGVVAAIAAFGLITTLAIPWWRGRLRSNVDRPAAKKKAAPDTRQRDRVQAARQAAENAAKAADAAFPTHMHTASYEEGRRLLTLGVQAVAAGDLDAAEQRFGESLVGFTKSMSEALAASEVGKAKAAWLTAFAAAEQASLRKSSSVAFAALEDKAALAAREASAGRFDESLKLYREATEALVRLRLLSVHASASAPSKPGKREDPLLLTVRDLRAVADFGVFGPDDGSEQIGRRWVVLTGIVPCEEQLAAFSTALQSRPFPASDTPRYVACEVERAESPRNASRSSPQWLYLASFHGALENRGAWDVTGPEVVPDAFVNQRLTQPLGSLRGRAWDASIAHPPEIPLLAGDLDAPADPTRPRLYLLRYFDYSVKPGCSYSYRVRLVLENPNFDRQRQLLADPESASRKYVRTDWSQPSAVATTAREDQPLLLLVQPALRKYRDPDVTIIIAKWRTERGGCVYKRIGSDDRSLKNLCGQWLNISGVALDPPPNTGQDGADASTRPTKRARTPVDYRTDALLLDVCGGERFPGQDRGTAPAYMLLWNHAQELVVQSDVDDRRDVLTAMGREQP